MTSETLLSFPSILVYHCTLFLRASLSWIIRVTKATSPPVVTISISAPVHAEFGGRDFLAAELSRSEEEA